MRKALLIIAIVVLALVPVAAYVLVVNSPVRADVRAYYSASTDRQELTQQQQADLEESHQKMIDLRKETIDKMVQDGLLTAEQAQQALQQLDEMAAYHAEFVGAYGYGRMNGCYVPGESANSAGNYYNRGMMRGYYGANGSTDSDGSYYGRGMMRGFYDPNDSTDSDGNYSGRGMMRGYNWN